MSSNIVSPSYAAVNGGMAESGERLLALHFASTNPNEPCDGARRAESAQRHLAELGVRSTLFYTENVYGYFGDCGLAIGLPSNADDYMTAAYRDAIEASVRRVYDLGSRRLLRIEEIDLEAALPCIADDSDINAPEYATPAALLAAVGAPVGEWDEGTADFWNDEVARTIQAPRLPTDEEISEAAGCWERTALNGTWKRWKERANELHVPLLPSADNAKEWTAADWKQWFRLGVAEKILPEKYQPYVTLCRLTEEEFREICGEDDDEDGGQGAELPEPPAPPAPACSRGVRQKQETPASPSDLPTPKKLGDAAFHGIIGDYVKRIEQQTEADPAAILIHALTYFGNMLGRSIYFQVENDRHYPNFYAVVVGATGWGRKGVAEGRAKQLIAGLDREWEKRFMQPPGSGEALPHFIHDKGTVFRRVRNSPTQLEEIADENRPGVADKRAMIEASEFATLFSIMAREGNTVSDIMRLAWDGKRIGIQTKHCNVYCNEPHVSAMGAITKDELLKCVRGGVAVSNGFLNRFMLFHCRKQRKLPRGGARINASDLQDRLRTSLDMIQHASRGGAVEMTMSDETWQLWDHAYNTDLGVERGGLIGNMMVRHAPQVLRLAMIYAAADGAFVVEASHLRAALELRRYSLDTLAWVFGGTTGDDVADEIVEQLKHWRDHPESPRDGLTRDELHGIVFKGHKGKRVINDAIALLERQRIVEIIKIPTAGRPRTVVRLKTSEPRG